MADHDAHAADLYFAEPTIRPAAKPFDREAHLAHLKALATAYDARKATFGFIVTDRTPAGYGPTC